MGWKTAGLIRVSGLTDGTDVDVLEAIASFLNEEDGRCFPALESVMLVARKSRNIVRQSIKALCEQGLLSFSAEPGKVRSYVIHVHNLPEPKLECFKEFFRTELGKKGTPVQKLTGFRSEPGSVVNGEGVQKCTPTGFRSEPGGGSEVNPEQGIEQGINRERNRERFMRTSGNSSAIAAVASAQAQTPYPEDFDKSLFDEAEREARSFPEPLPEPPAQPPVEQPASTPARPKMAYPPCQYEKVVELYHANCRGLRRVLALTDARKRTINARWREFCKEDDLKTTAEALESFEWYFQEVSKSRFLMGYSTPGPGRDRPFKADFDWLMCPTNFLKVCEGKYSNGPKN